MIRPSWPTQPLDAPARNRVGERWHRIRSNGWTYQDPVNRIVTYCGLEADNPPYTNGPVDEVDDCAACRVALAGDVIAWGLGLR